MFHSVRPERNEMNRMILKWKLGWKVFWRSIIFAIAMNVVLLAMVPLKVLDLVNTSSPLGLKLVAGGVALVVLGGIFPLMMYWAAQWTDQLQGSDEKTFKELKGSNKRNERYGA